MEEHPLLRTVASWPGRGPAQLAFEALGFSIHRAWQNRIVQSCGEQQAHLLNRYWDEIALETMQSLGMGAPDQRAFGIQPEYSSAFLDDLFAARDFVEPPFVSPPLIKCLFERSKKIWFDAEFRDTENAFFDSLQAAEAERNRIQVTELSTKRDVIPFIEEFCGALGFERHRNRWRKSVAGGLVFEVGVDLGGNRFRIKSRLMFRIFHVDDAKYTFDIDGPAVLDRLVPGVAQYFPGKHASEYVLGIKAYIELFNIIAASFADSAPCRIARAP
jgi:hypothetical protein